jgi:hypothetical protein
MSKMSTNFHVTWDVADGKPKHRDNKKCHINLVRFHAQHVHAKVASCDGSFNKFFLESGQVVLWRNEFLDNALSLAFFERDAMNDVFPTLVLPLGQVVSKNCTYFISGTVGERARFLVKTSCSLDTRLTIKPMDVTFYLNRDDAKRLDSTMMDSFNKWPNQSVVTSRAKCRSSSI